MEQDSFVNLSNQPKMLCVCVCVVSIGFKNLERKPDRHEGRITY